MAFSICLPGRSYCIASLCSIMQISTQSSSLNSLGLYFHNTFSKLAFKPSSSRIPSGIIRIADCQLSCCHRAMCRVVTTHTISPVSMEQLIRVAGCSRRIHFNRSTSAQSPTGVDSSISVDVRINNDRLDRWRSILVIRTHWRVVTGSCLGPNGL